MQQPPTGPTTPQQYPNWSASQQSPTDQPQYYQPPQGYPQQPPQGWQPQYQQPVQPPKKKSKWPLGCAITAFVVVLLFVFAIIAAASGGNKNTGTLASSTPGATQTTTSTGQHFKVGDTVAVGSTWKATINSITTNTGDGQFYVPKNGAYVIVDVTLSNVSGKEQTVSSIVEFTMKGADGTKYDETFASGLDGVSPAPDGKVEAGGLLKGDFVYDISPSVKTFTFAFEPDFLSSGQTIWDLNL